MTRADILSSNPEVMSGAVVFTGTRVPVEILVQHLTAGESLEVFLDDFPSVSREQAAGFIELPVKGRNPERGGCQRSA